MRYIILSIILLALSFITLTAQTDTALLLRTPLLNAEGKILTYEETFWGLRVYNGKKVLSHKEIHNFLQSDPVMLKKYNNGRKTLIAGDVVAVAGVISLGYGIFTTVNAYGENYGFDLNDRVLGYSLIGAGAIAAATGVLLFFNGQKKMKLAINAYNDELITASFKLGFTRNGLGLLVEF